MHEITVVSKLLWSQILDNTTLLTLIVSAYKLMDCNSLNKIFVEEKRKVHEVNWKTWS